MIKETRLLESALGDGIKKIEINEKKSSKVQKRGIYATEDIKKNESFRNKITVLRPVLFNSLTADKFSWLKSKKAKSNIKKGECINLKKVSF